VESHCQYLAPIAFPDALEAGLRIGHIGRSSVRYEIGIFKREAPTAAAQGYFVHVFVDRVTRRSVEIPSALRRALELLGNS
jgi:acyl-CoA thioester hydrolase